jgi:hypothetical protein
MVTFAKMILVRPYLFKKKERRINQTLHLSTIPQTKRCVCHRFHGHRKK